MNRKRKFNISIDGIPVAVTRKKVKHLRIVAYPSSGRVRISSPMHVPDREIINFASERSNWIRKHLSNPDTELVDKEPEFRNGSTHFIWGDPYFLKVEEGANRTMVRLGEDKSIRMYLKNGYGPEIREPVMREWYRRSIKQKIPPLIKKWEPVMNVSVRDWGVKKMKTRWGTCNTQAGRIWLNLELAKRSPEFLEYIVVHEMTHLLERPHSRRFYQLMDRFLPGWRETDKRLGGRHWKRY
ncbi:M48 family peptidase [Rhodohalobacter sp. SW132]|uniref:M48 family metallopeptidase n=1 Tax=Rhodohalobacter sp. SW132 TaxID=2293433 RepID=UPI000E27ED9C|nr:SprT family zinc-dependent metalloprotease [Rhodohalobacter sp. SW132]REL25059.1 M48 family peptidase [Rhodohalobacter sp. SW132]